ncbi:MAG: hypothetical protein ACYDCK_12525 [Thermoplasmatota archaeon]
MGIGRTVFFWSMFVLAAFVAIFLSVKAPGALTGVSHATGEGAGNFATAIRDALAAAWARLASNFQWG